ncbi:MAG TPA: hypothetical protein VJ985_00390, partial [Gammaproteobacteria bacterium]|nr:hypothetical protein [Gammaproteobacteria bacterium]
EDDLSDLDPEQIYHGDGNQAYNFLLTYVLKPVTLKAMYGDTEGNTNETVHFGMDYHFADNLKFFAEYYQDEGGGFAPVGYDALQSDTGSSGFNNPESQGGSVFTVGAHMSFSSSASF